MSCRGLSLLAASRALVDALWPLAWRVFAFGIVMLALTACVREPRAPLGTELGVWYVVQPGETLSDIAARSGVSVAEIAEANHLQTAVLRVGQRLWIPGIRALPAAAPPPSSPPSAAPPAARAADGYVLVPRSAWTSEPIGPNHVLMGAVTKITIHHTDEHGGMDELSDIEIIRRIEHYHRTQKRWAAIGYHYLIGRDGKVYEGRPARYQGAHCGKNENNLGISVIGDFHRRLPNEKQLRALEAFLDDQRARYGIPRSRVYGHRDIKPTICPGDALYAWVKNYAGR
ncbi:MAG: N-acetylmuramoyl-L-alanine amidase [Planctomycetota bacterium]|nr:N-acetylmuramoyl-L-alanine amidase [Planctomycetota bacterium]MCX8039170.1 N-acetylmuramoyl-L-alanine amidase [Planctomycetota bacterium]MDW8373531.1 N-acetylmuramoyl-L-alanine amidase [Planctomycetota bacterium]